MLSTLRQSLDTNLAWRSSTSSAHDHDDDGQLWHAVVLGSVLLVQAAPLHVEPVRRRRSFGPRPTPGVADPSPPGRTPPWSPPAPLVSPAARRLCAEQAAGGCSGARRARRCRRSLCHAGRRPFGPPGRREHSRSSRASCSSSPTASHHRCREASGRPAPRCRPHAGCRSSSSSTSRQAQTRDARRLWDVRVGYPLVSAARTPVAPRR